MLTSEALSKRAAAVTPGGVHSNVPLAGPRPFIARGDGARIWDVDGNEYIDYLLGQGSSFLGHAPSDVDDAVSSACRDGIVFGGQHPTEVEAAEAVISALCWPDMVRFTSTGTEAVQATVRLARAHTGRRLVVRFEGQYHGWLDNVLLARDGIGWGKASPGQLSGDLSESIVLAWNDPQAVDTAFDRHGSEIAGILTEPAMLNSGAIPPRAEFLEHLRAVADAHGSLLIFDEVITGFRLALGGGAERFGVAPDLAAYGKAIAAGYPVAAFAGRADVMERLAAGVNHAGTFNGNRMGAAAVLANLSRLRESTVYEQVAAHGTALLAALPRIAGECGRELNVHGFPMAFHVSFGNAEVTDWRSLQQLGLAEYVRFASPLVDNGLWVTDRGVWYVSVAHGPRELTETQERFEEALRAWSQAEDQSRSATWPIEGPAR